MRPHRRPPAVVLWGGRAGVDLQAGSRADRGRARRLDREAELLHAMGTGLAQMRRALVTFGVNAAEAVERMRPAIEALDRVGREHRARQLSGAAALGRVLAAEEERRANVRRLLDEGLGRR